MSFSLDELFDGVFDWDVPTESKPLEPEETPERVKHVQRFRFLDRFETEAEAKEDLRKNYARLRSLPKMGRHYGVCAQTVLNAMQHFGLPRSPKGVRVGKKKKKRGTYKRHYLIDQFSTEEEAKKEIRKVYAELQSLKKVADHYGSHPSTVHKVMQDLGLKFRKPGGPNNKDGRYGKVYTVKGQRGTIRTLCEYFGNSYRTAYQRIHRGWSVADAVSIPRQPTTGGPVPCPLRSIIQTKY